MHEVGRKRTPVIRVISVDTKARLGHALILFVVLAFFGIGLYLQPNPEGYGTHQQLGLPPCTIHFLTGRPCPSCGLTTSVSAWLHGQFALGWRAHPMGVLIVLFALGLGLNSLMALARGRSLWFHPNAVSWGLVALLMFWLLYGLIRFLLA